MNSTGFFMHTLECTINLYVCSTTNSNDNNKWHTLLSSLNNQFSKSWEREKWKAKQNAALLPPFNRIIKQLTPPRLMKLWYAWTFILLNDWQFIIISLFFIFFLYCQHQHLHFAIHAFPRVSENNKKKPLMKFKVDVKRRKFFKRYRQRVKNEEAKERNKWIKRILKSKKYCLSCNPYLMVIFRIKNSLQAKIKRNSSELRQQKRNVISASSKLKEILKRIFFFLLIYLFEMNK